MLGLGVGEAINALIDTAIRIPSGIGLDVSAGPDVNARAAKVTALKSILVKEAFMFG